MVAHSSENYLLDNGDIDEQLWLAHYRRHHPASAHGLVSEACYLAHLAGAEHPTQTGHSCLQKGLAMAELLASLGQDAETVACGLIFECLANQQLDRDIILENLGDEVHLLASGVLKMDAAQSLVRPGRNNQHNENIRMMLLAMVSDVRVVVIKLVERVCNLRAAMVLGEREKIELADETLTLYAPLANRLGLIKLRWELEDLALRLKDNATYKALAHKLKARRVERQAYVDNMIALVRLVLDEAKVPCQQISGRIKHIYSIYRKMQRKHLPFEQIFDVTALRIIVSDVETCYRALSAIHSQWPHIAEEFDDYIATPKPNGYQSIHTVVKGPEEHNIEIQIRTKAMHDKNELGVAAHWVYKEGKQQNPSHEAKIAWLRQVLAWQDEVGTQAHHDALDEDPQQVFADRIYAFTPKGDVLDLPSGATPLDFAYSVHTQVGHRCRGAKINGKIVTLDYQLRTGDEVEILTTKIPAPSRDWLNHHLGYLKTPRAKAKVHHWFKQQDFGKNHELGQDLLQAECKRLNLALDDLPKVAERYNYSKVEDVFAAIGCGDLSVHQVINYLQQHQQSTKPAPRPIRKAKPSKQANSDIEILGVDNLLTHVAKCCRPLPGEAIIGFITQGRGVSIHRVDCHNIANANEQQRQRLIDVEWARQAQSRYPATLVLKAHDRQGLLRDVTQYAANAQLNVLAINSETDFSDSVATIYLTIEVEHHEKLDQIMAQLRQITNVFHVNRQRLT